MRKINYIITFLLIIGLQAVSASDFIESRIVLFEFQTTQSYELEEDALNEAFSIEDSIARRNRSGFYKNILKRCELMKRIQKPIIVKLRKDEMGKSIGRILVKVRCL